MMQTVSFVKYKMLLALLFGVSLQQTVFGAACGPTVALCGDTALNQTITDSNINITCSPVNINGTVTVQALTCNVAINLVPSAPTVIKGKNGTSPQLIFQANPGQTITFNVTDNVAFQGADDGTNMPIQFIGGGQFVFNLSDGVVLSFTSNGLGGGGVQAYVAATGSGSNGLLFQRNSINSAANVEVVVGANSVLSYVGSSAGTGSIIWNVGNLNPAGFFILRIQNDGLVAIQVQNNLSVPSTLNPNATALFEIDNNIGGTTSLGSLRIINGNTHLTDYRSNPFCLNNWFDQFGGAQYGFILGANGNITITSGSYLDYIGTTTNQNPTPNIPAANVQSWVFDLKEDGEISQYYEVLKQRNPSAFIVDGDISNPSLIAQINFLGDAAVYFRSGCDDDGNVSPDFTLTNTFEMTEGPGEYVFDVEGELNVNGGSTGINGLNILSLQVDPTGCPVDNPPTSSNLNFPMRTFNRDSCGNYLQYNRAAFLINARMNLNQTYLIHTDELHQVFERITLLTIGLDSQPTYVGGETFKVCARCVASCDSPICDRPTIALYGGSTLLDKQAEIRFHTNAGFTGVDVRVPNTGTDRTPSNFSALRFYSNGYCIDQGYGRYAIFGMNTGAFSQDGTVLIDGDSHLDIFQDDHRGTQSSTGNQTLQLLQGSNTTCVTEAIVGDISAQRSVHTIFLGNNSNVTVGGKAATDVSPLTTTSSLLINDDFFSFESQGGSHRLPETSGTTGQGGIFVDQNGSFGIPTTPCAFRANIGAMVTKSGNASINLPRNQVFFAFNIGITDWNLDLTPTNSVIIAQNQNLTQYTLDWGAAKKDCVNFIPYGSFVQTGSPNEIQCVPNACHTAAVVQANLTAIPTINGQVDQLQLKRARLGDTPHIMVDGGFVRELVFLPGGNTAEAPMAVVAVTGNGKIGLNTNFRNPESSDTSGLLGVNGITIVADGNGVIELNETLEVDNVCHILPGPNFLETHTLQFHSHEIQELRIRSGATLDMSQFTDNMSIKFTGQVHLIFEPGSKWMIGSSAGGAGPIIYFTDKTHLSIEKVTNISRLNGATLPDLDPVRVKFMGQGTLFFNEFATLDALHDTIMTIGSDSTCSTVATNITITLNDQAQFQIGNDGEPGGVFEVGNAVSQLNVDQQPILVNFTLNIAGQGVICQVNRQGLFGLGVGIANKVSTTATQWLIGNLFNVGNVAINLNQGTFASNQIVRADVPNLSSLIALGNSGTFTFSTNPSLGTMLGGSNMLQASSAAGVVFNPPVFDVDGAVSPTVNATIIQSLPMIEDQSNSSLPGVTSFNSVLTCGPTTPFNLFTFWKVKTIGTTNAYNMPMACIAPSQTARAVIAYILASTSAINRTFNFQLRGGADASLQTSYNHAFGHGAVSLKLQNTAVNNIQSVVALHRGTSASLQNK